MANGVFNIAKGMVARYTMEVDTGDPAAAQIVVWLAIGAITDATLKDLDTVAAVIADAGVTEAVFTNYARKDLDDANVSVTVDDSGDKNDADLDDQTWSSAGNGANDTLTRLYTAYDSTGSATDANLVPLTFHDFAVTTDGSDLTAQFNSQGFFTAS